MESAGVLHGLPQRDNEDEELNLYFKVIKTVSMKVKKSETVGNVLLKRKEVTAECLQEIFYTGDQLQDGKRLIDCDIQQNSTLNIFVQNSVPLRLNIKTPSDKVIVVETKSYDSIQNVKSLISAKEGIPSDHFSRIHAGKELQNDKILACLSIQKGSTLHMVPKRRYEFPISVKMPSGETLKIAVNLLQTVCDIKTIVESMAGFPIGDVNLTYEGRQLELAKALYCYNVTEESVLDISPQPQPQPIPGIHH